MSVNLVTGYKGEPHITAADMGAFNASIFGAKQYVVDSTGALPASLPNANTLRIGEGDIIMQGRHIRITSDNDLVIETGTTGYNRIDLVVMEYSMDTNSSVETATFKVLKGTPTTGAAVAPEYEIGNILSGDMLNQMPLYRVTLTGVNVGTPEPLFTTSPSLAWAKPERGTDSAGWSYTKWPDGTYEATKTANVTTLAGKAWGGGYYHQQSTIIRMPSWAENFKLVSAIPSMARLLMVCGVEVNATNVSVYIYDFKSSADTVEITYTIRGQYMTIDTQNKGHAASVSD